MSATSRLASILSSEQGQISCFDIEVFHLNQRRSKNPKYDDIKESARSKGIQDPLHIVFHPEQNKWILSQGGQTRLLICRELYEETGSQSFLYPATVKQSFTSDLDLCINHLVENHLRGDNTFLETANAVVNIRKLVADSQGAEPTQEELAVEMSRCGMPIRRQSITAMLYLAETVSPNVSNQAFLDGVSRKVIDSIRVLRKSLEQSIPNDDFDAQLVAFINSRSDNVSLKSIRNHFQPVDPHLSKATPRSNKAVASHVSDVFGLKGIVQGTDSLPSGYLVALPEDTENKLQAEVCFFLTGLSGVFEGAVSEDVLLGMGLDGIGSDPTELASAVRERLNLVEADLLGLPSRVFCRANDKAFESLVRLITGVRTSFHSNNNNNPLEKS